MDGHVVLVGLGAVGLRTLEGLRAEDRDVVAVERDEGNRYVQHARSLGGEGAGRPDVVELEGLLEAVTEGVDRVTPSKGPTRSPARDQRAA